jgi:hypothetical protein
LTVSGAATGAKSVSAYARLASSGTTCQSANAATVTAVVNLQPTITRRSGNASQTVSQGTAITPIVYTANNSATISRSGSTFPTTLTGAANGSSYTISGTPSATGTFGYSLTASNGCASTAAVGTITVVAGPPQYAACTNTWVYGSQTWSCPIRIPSCNKPDFTFSTTSADCIAYTSGTNTFYFYNWPYVNQYATTMCPSPWRMPSRTDVTTLMAQVSYTTLLSAWGGGGCMDAVLLRYNLGGHGRWWTGTGDSGTNAYRLAYSAVEYNITIDGRATGNQVRCVK